MTLVWAVKVKNFATSREARTGGLFWKSEDDVTGTIFSTNRTSYI